MDIVDKSGIPIFLKEMLNNQYGEKITNSILKGYVEKRVVSFRVNTIKSKAQLVLNEMENAGIKCKPVLWCQDAFITESLEEKIKKLPVYENGEIYLQSLSSMLPPIILDPKPNTDILDMAAAPGGKTTQIATMTSNKAHITACEMNLIRAERLKYNIEKQGASSVYVMVKDARKIDDFFSFDQILLDSPCSGSGTLNLKDKTIGKTFTTKLIDKCVKSQTSLLRKAINILKPGKEMVYSTCSILQCENEDVVNTILKEKNVEIVPIKLDQLKCLPMLPTKIRGTICVTPNKYYEGFFIAKIRKK